MSKNLPSVTSQIPRDLRNFVDRLREIINGGGSGRMVTAQDLADAGVVTIGTDGGLTAAAVTTDYGTPPAPTGVTATAAIRNVIVEWDDPAYPTHAYAEVWGASTNNIGAAVLLGQTPGSVYADELGPSATRYYWVRFVNTQFTTGPYNGTSGAGATTGSDLSYTMGLLRDTYGGTSEAPFFQLNSPTVINGVTIPAGTYMKTAYIYDGEITNAKIANAAIDDAKIANLSAAKITAGTIAADRLTSAVINAKVTNIDTSVIQSGFIDAARINTASIANAKITNANIDAGTISAAKIDKATITNLSSLSADMGTLTAGTIRLPATGNSYLIIDGANNRLEVYDNGVLRVRIGNLA